MVTHVLMCMHVAVPGFNVMGFQCQRAFVTFGKKCREGYLIDEKVISTMGDGSSVTVSMFPIRRPNRKMLQVSLLKKK